MRSMRPNGLGLLARLREISPILPVAAGSRNGVLLIGNR
jgi:hypothetical protein